MRKWLLSGVAVALAVASYAAHVQPSSAGGCGCGKKFNPGDGVQTRKIAWDEGTETPGVATPTLTGASAGKAQSSKPVRGWTAEQLKAGKPTLVYYFVADNSSQTEDAYKFSRKVEMGSFADENVEAINKDWIAKKRSIDIDSDRKLERNQARIEFWSFTGTKMGVVTTKTEEILNPSPFGTKLKEMVRRNRELCAAEILRMEQAGRGNEKTAAK